MLNAPRWAFRVLLIGVFTIALWLVWRCWRDPALRVLPPSASASWVLYPNPPDILAHPIPGQSNELSAVFRRSFVLQHLPVSALMKVRALESFRVEVNGRVAVATNGVVSWKQPSEFAVTQLLQIGTNEIVVTVTNRAGPPLLWFNLSADELALNSDSSWQASYAGAVWQSVRLADSPPQFRPGNAMRSDISVAISLRRKAFSGITLLLLALVIALLARRTVSEPKQPLTKSEFTKLILGGLALLWVLLFVHNVSELSPLNGFDAAHHVGYIKYIQDHHALPKAEQGWETHQPPLYYVFSAAMLEAVQWDAITAEGIRALRYLSMLFGIGQIFLVFASLRLLFPNELNRPLIGAAMAALLPAHLYHAHYVTNETFLALLASGVFYLTLRVLRSGRANPWWSAALGACLGAALLTKLSALIIAPVVLLALATRLIEQRSGWRNWIGTFGIVSGVCLLVCGWYYWRLWKAGGPWNQSQWAYGAGWWQEEGYRTASYYLRFGQSLFYPLYSGFHSFWDGIYSTLWGDGLCGGSTSVDFRPPWDYDHVGLGYWLALLPTVLVVLGFIVIARKMLRRPASEWLLLIGATLLFAIALFYFSLVAPGTSQVRASFGLMLLVPFCAMFATGFARIASLRRLAGVVVVTLTVLCGLNSFCAHWVSASSAQPQLARAKLLFESRSFASAAHEAEEGLRRDPTKSSLRSMLADCWNQLGKTNEARQLIQHALGRWPNDPMVHLDVGFEHAQAGNFDAAIAETRRAILLAPDHAMAARELFLLLAKQRRFEKAEAARREALRINPYDPTLHARPQP